MLPVFYTDHILYTAVDSVTHSVEENLTLTFTLMKQKKPKRERSQNIL